MGHISKHVENIEMFEHFLVALSILKHYGTYLDLYGHIWADMGGSMGQAHGLAPRRSAHGADGATQSFTSSTSSSSATDSSKALHLRQHRENLDICNSHRG